MRYNLLQKTGMIGICIIMCITNLFIQAKPVYADTDYAQEAENRKSLPIQSNQIENWPQGPQIGAGGRHDSLRQKYRRQVLSRQYH